MRKDSSRPTLQLLWSSGFGLLGTSGNTKGGKKSHRSTLILGGEMLTGKRSRS
jgi:hypothetical protein